MDLASLHVKPLVLGGVILGGLIFGVGMTLLGYCPGTGEAAVAEGSRHAIFGVLGMLAGAAVYAEVAPLMKATVLQIGDFGKLTLVDATGLSPWVSSPLWPWAPRCYSSRSSGGSGDATWYPNLRPMNNPQKRQPCRCLHSRRDTRPLAVRGRAGSWNLLIFGSITI
jgi:hypothetical protein